MFAPCSCLARLPARLAKLVARFSAGRDGATAIEFAIIAVPFFLIIMATVQTAIIYMAEQELETATEQSSRYILTNQGGNYNQTTFAKVVCNQVVALFDCSKLMIDLEDYGSGTSFSSANTAAPTLTFKPDGSVGNAWSYTAGAPGDIMVLRVMYQWPVFLKPFGFNLSNLSNGNRLMMATAVFKNEP
jgi:Flp pilus assembly protein TadG